MVVMLTCDDPMDIPHCPVCGSEDGHKPWCPGVDEDDSDALAVPGEAEDEDADGDEDD